MERTLTCIECPRGCTLLVKSENGEITVSGNFCPKGEIYGKNEVTNPVRIVTGTVRCKGVMLPVKTDRAVKKSKIFEVMERLRAVSLLTKVDIGDIIVENVDGEGVNIVACASVK